MRSANICVMATCLQHDCSWATQLIWGNAVYLARGLAQVLRQMGEWSRIRSASSYNWHWRHSHRNHSNCQECNERLCRQRYSSPAMVQALPYCKKAQLYRGGFVMDDWFGIPGLVRRRCGLCEKEWERRTYQCVE